MAIANYISLDNKYYKVLAPGYERDMELPKTIRRGVLGNTIVAVGPGSPDKIVRSIFYVPFTPGSGWGSLSDLETAANKTSVSYTDHITSDSSKWLQGTFNITIMRVEKIVHLGESPRPEIGYTVAVEWMKVLS